MSSTNISPQMLKSFDCTVIVTGHSVYSFREIVANSRLIIDTRNVAGCYSDKSDKIVVI